MEGADGEGQCALLNETLLLPERGATSAERQPVNVGFSHLTDTRLFWIVVMSALSGTCLVLLTVAVAVLMRRVCCYVDVDHRRRRHHHHHHPQRGSSHHLLSSRRRRCESSGDCPCRHSTSPPLSQLPLVDTDRSDDLAMSARCDATQV